MGIVFTDIYTCWILLFCDFFRKYLFLWIPHCGDHSKVAVPELQVLYINGCSKILRKHVSFGYASSMVATSGSSGINCDICYLVTHFTRARMPCHIHIPIIDPQNKLINR